MNSTHSIIRAADSEEICVEATKEFLQIAAEAIAERGRFTVALSGGSTPRMLYQLLSGRPYRMRVEWSQVEVFWGDERSVSPDDVESNFRMASEAMLGKLPIPEGNIHRMEAEREDLDVAASDYQKTIAGVLDVPEDGPPPRLDLVLLGMGPDGHTASLFPHTAALREKRRWVVANEVPQLQTNRMTMTTPMINAARSVQFLVVGASKADPLAEVLYGASEPEQFPSQLISPTNGTLNWFIDDAAAAKLPASESK